MLNESDWLPVVDWGTYEDVISSVGLEVVAVYYLDDYQGDACGLFKDEDRYYFGTWGFGSCSGCDWLQGCDGDPKQLAELRQSLVSDLKPLETPQDVLVGLICRDWEGSWYGEQKGFVKKAVDALKVRVPFREQTKLLLLNPECLPEICADAVDEDGQERMAVALRRSETKWTAKRLLEELIKQETEWALSTSTEPTSPTGGGQASN